MGVKGLKAGYHWRQSRSRSRSQKGRVIQSSENQTDGVGSRKLILLMSPLLKIRQVKTALSESQAEAEEQTNDSVRFQTL